MNIGLLISGNLTGFGRFYTSPAASDLLGSEKISFDNHSFLPFLGDDEKAYSITFAKRLIAISQYTQILDSFRRPGKLVVSLLIPRNYAIESNSGSPRGAVYSLLTKISNRFFEKNFLDGMINQNLAVLGQDYYSEILEGYSLKPIDSKRINENPAPMKKVGYVRAAELDMPSYLDTPYRKSYGDGGYNLIFFAPSAPVGTPNSIDEEPEEVVLYRVKILNTGAILPNPVKLSSPLYKLQARDGEEQFPDEGTYKLTNDYLESRPSTYQDVIDHFLEPRITGRIVPGDTLEIQYNFEKEEKTIKFVFVDMATSTPVSLDLVLPSIVFSDGSRQPISSDTFTFRGSEIYDEKRLVAENASISISSRSEKLDLTHSSNGQEYKVYVQQGFSLSVNPELMGITISFVNRSTRQTLSFTNQNKINLPGKASDWNVYVETEQYSAPVQALKVQNNGRWAINNLQQKSRKEVKKAENLIKPSGSAVAVQSKPWSLPQIRKIGGQDANVVLDDERNRYFKWHKYVVLIPIVLLVIGGGWWAYKEFAEKPEQLLPGEGEDTGNHTPERCCYLIYYDNTPNIKSRDTIESSCDETLSKHYTHYSFMLLDEDKEPLTEKDYLFKQDDLYDSSKAYLRHKLTISEDCNSKTYYIRVSYLCGDGAFQLIDEEIPDSILNANGMFSVNLGIRLSQLKWYDEISSPDFKFKDELAKNNKLMEIAKLKDSQFSRELLKLAKSKDFQRNIESPTSIPTSSSKEVPSPTQEQPSTGFPDLLTGNSWLNANQLRNNYKQNKVSRDVYNRAQAMANALDQVSKMKEASTKGLDQTQQTTIKKYNTVRQDKKFLEILKREQANGRLTSFSQLWNLVKD